MLSHFGVVCVCLAHVLQSRYGRQSLAASAGVTFFTLLLATCLTPLPPLTSNDVCRVNVLMVRCGECIVSILRSGCGGGRDYCASFSSRIFMPTRSACITPGRVVLFVVNVPLSPARLCTVHTEYALVRGLCKNCHFVVLQIMLVAVGVSSSHFPVDVD